MTSNIMELRRRKLIKELQTRKHMDRLGIHPLKALDDLIEGLMDLARIGLKERYPEAAEKQILILMREQTNIYNQKRNRRID